MLFLFGVCSSTGPQTYLRLLSRINYLCLPVDCLNWYITSLFIRDTHATYTSDNIWQLPTKPEQKLRYVSLRLHRASNKHQKHCFCCWFFLNIIFFKKVLHTILLNFFSLDMFHSFYWLYLLKKTKKQEKQNVPQGFLF